MRVLIFLKINGVSEIHIDRALMFLCDLLWIGMVEKNHMADLNNSDKALLGWFVHWGIRSTKRLSLWVFLAV